MTTKTRLAAMLLMFVVVTSCNNNASESDKIQTVVDPSNESTADYSKQVAASETMKAGIEAAAAGYARKEIDLAKSAANASIKQEWAKMDVYSDSTGIRKIKLYPHKGISERSEEFYYNNGKMFFTFISDSGLNNENKDENRPGKEFHFMGEKLLKYDDKSGDKENNPVEEKKMYELRLALEAEELYTLAGGK
ncbi:MAG: hypothetical protein ABI685_05540 [Ferruginibacter sp.]